MKNKIKITLRKAKPQDCRKIYFLYSEPLSRKFSLSSEKVSYANHKKWFTNKLADKNYLILAAENKGKFVGQVRFEIEGNEALTGVSVHKKFRGYGLGKTLLADGMAYLKIHFPKVKFAIGQIMPENIAAIKNSQFVGFKFEKCLILNNKKINQYRLKLE